jgi:tryptophanyl-tRNA synthetase
VRRFNAQFGDLLIEPQAKLTETPRIMGLDAVNKMSKSLDNHLELAATPEDTRRRVMTMVTDPARRYKTDPGHPEICNVWALHKIFSNDPAAIAQIEVDCRAAQIGCVAHKKQFAEDLNRALAPFRERRAELACDPDKVWGILADGASRARLLAQETMTEVKKAVGLP